MSDKTLDAAKALFLHNMETFEDLPTDHESVEAAWLLDEGVRDFWVAQVRIVQKALEGDTPGQCPACGNLFDGDNFCMPSACQWEGIEFP